MLFRFVLPVLAAVLAAFPLSANLITNGSFETIAPGCSSPGAGFYAVFPPPGTQCISAWTVVSEDVHYMGTYWESADGVRNIDLDGNTSSSGGVQQTFATLPGVSYLVTFFMAGNPQNLPIIKPMRVSADGQSADFEFDITGKTRAAMGWTEMNWTFVADDASATLTFQSLTQERGLTEGWGPALDNVSVTEISAAIPEPATWLLSSGALAFLFLGRLALARR